MDDLKSRAMSDMHMASYLSDELDEWVKQLIPLATDEKTRARLQATLSQVEARSAKRREKLAKSRYNT